MSDLSIHYNLLLGLTPPWSVASVALSVESKCVDIHVERSAGPVQCPECGKSCSIADHAPTRTWRHLDTMRFETRLHASVPRSDCSNCGIKTATIPWAGKHSRFTWSFEAFAIEVLTACSTLGAAANLLGLSWDCVHGIMKRAVGRGMERRETEPISTVGIDEKSFLKGQCYVSLMVDLDQARVLDVVEGRDGKAAKQLVETIPEAFRPAVRAVALDMWPAFTKAVREGFENAQIVHDKFHLAKYLNEAVDKVRRAEHKRLREQNDESLTGTKYMWLRTEGNIPGEQWNRFSKLKEMNLETGRAWVLKEQFPYLFEEPNIAHGVRYFREWQAWVKEAGIPAVQKVADMFDRHRRGILANIVFGITNATCEGFNSRIQSIKSAARGFRSFKNYRTRILFFCGRLDLGTPLATH